MLWSSVGSILVFYNKLSWFVSELPEKDISNVVHGLNCMPG
jgi:hypothetical protein